MAEQNNELLMKNHKARPTGFAPFPEVNVTAYQPHNQIQGRGRGRVVDVVEVVYVVLVIVVVIPKIHLAT